MRCSTKIPKWTQADDVLVIDIEVRWALPELDILYTDFLDRILEQSEQTAGKMLHPFRYLNYAAAGQDVWQLLRQQGRLDQVKALRDQYDPTHFLKQRLSQPFSLGDIE